MFLLSRKYTGALFGALLTGLLVGVAFPTVSPVPALALVLPLAFIPLFAVLEQLPVQSGGSPRSHARLARSTFLRRGAVAFLLCWIAGFVFELLAVHWMPTPITRISGSSQLAAIAIGVGYAAIAALHFPLVLLPFIANASRGIKRLSHPFPLWAMAVVSMGIELMLPQIWPWRLGGLLARVDGLAQWLSLFGASALTPFVLGTSAWLARALTGVSGSLPRFGVAFVSAAALWGTLWGLGIWRQDVLEARFAPLERNVVGFVQADADVAGKLRVEEVVRNRPDKLERLLRITRSLLDAQRAKSRKVDLVVWPEGVLPAEFLSSQLMQDEVRALSREHGVPVLVQALEFEPGQPASGGARTTAARKAACLFRPDGSRSDAVHQWNPIPFQELVPFEEVLPFLGDWVRRHSEVLRPWRPGQNAGAIPFSPDVKVGVLLGFDVTSSEFARNLAGKHEAGLFVHVSDFTFLAGTTAPRIPIEFARWRALEMGRSMVSVSNTGPSAAFSPTGVAMPLDLGAGGAWAVTEVPVLDAENFTETFYSELGNAPIILLGLAGFIYLVFSFWRRGR